MKKEIFKTEGDRAKASFWGIVFVMLIWGAAPLLTVYMLEQFSASIYTAIGGFTSAIALTLLFCRQLKNLNKDYLKIAVPTGLCSALAAVLQKIGLQYTTPTKYIFLENLSCVVVPFLTWLLVGRKPSVFKIVAAVVCLASSFVLSGLNISSEGISLGVGETLCAAAGLLYGVNIAVTGAYSKRFVAGMYIMVHAWIQGVVGLVTALILNGVTGANGLPLEGIQLPTEIWWYLLLIVFVLFTSTFCWIVRTNCMKWVDASVVSVIMPLSAVVTGVLSVATRTEPLTLNLILGAILGLVAVFLSTYGDMRENKKAAYAAKEQRS